MTGESLLGERANGLIAFERPDDVSQLDQFPCGIVGLITATTPTKLGGRALAGSGPSR